jgi:mRNA-degrading endonuclease RelE of RelBE toxin-antitoxin system
MYRVITSYYLASKLKKLKFSEWHRLSNMKAKLESNPYAGKRLGNSLFEKKWGPFRILYIILEDVLVVILLEFTHKKDQRVAIDYVLSNWDDIIRKLKSMYS